MAGEGAEKKLYDAATIGDVATLKQLLETNQHLADVVSFSCLKNVLHIAIKQGQESIVEEVLKINPELALDLDSKNSSSLHIAAAKGNVEIAKRLLSIAPEMCWWRDCHDMNPIHVAAMKGNEEVLKEMLQRDSFPATERLHRGQTVLHLCVKHRQLGTLKVLVEQLGDLVSAKDEDGETLSHYAVRANQLEIVQYLKESDKLEKLTKNSTGKTAVDILDESFRDTRTYLKMKNILLKFSNQSIFQNIPKLSEMTMVAAILIATMAFQATLSPPGGVWQEDNSKLCSNPPGPWQDDTSIHCAGRSVFASTHPDIYKRFVHANIVAFISSLIAILFLATTGSSKQFVFVVMATYSMWVSVAAIGVSYGASLIMINPYMATFSFGNIVAISVILFLVVLLLVSFYPFKKNETTMRKLVKKVGFCDVV